VFWFKGFVTIDKVFVNVVDISQRNSVFPFSNYTISCIPHHMDTLFTSSLVGGWLGEAEGRKKLVFLE
jgi:hypothetical protein